MAARRNVKPSLKNAGLSAAVAVRAREERILQRFSQAELAEELGLFRAALSNYELGRVNMPFGVGLRICRGLDLNPRWLATGAEPKRPFITFEKLHVPEARIWESAVASRCDFHTGYEKFLKAPIEEWLAKTPMSAIILEQIKGGPASIAPRLSELELIKYAERFCESAGSQEKHRLRRSDLETAMVFLRELRKRAEAKYYRMPSELSLK